MIWQLTSCSPQFDDVPGSTLLPELYAVPTPYRNLAWTAFNVVTDALSTFRYPSGNQTAATFFGQSVLTASTPSIPISGPTTNYFDLSSLFLGCVVESQTGILPAPCTVILTGKKISGPDATYSFSYVSGTSFAPCQLQRSFVGLKTVNLALSNLVSTATTVFLLDSVKGTTYQ